VRGAAWIALALAGLLANGVALGWFARPVPPDLERLAGRSFGELTALEPIPLAPEGLGEVPPERSLFHAYRGPGGAEGVMFAAYYLEDRRWSGRPHPVEVCFAADGWTPGARRVLRAPSGARYHSSELERSGRRIRLVHWIQRPGALPGEGFWEGVRGRLRGAGSLRRDVLSVYWEFELAEAPADAVLVGACEALREAVEALWR
jgi:hypothetical protein